MRSLLAALLLLCALPAQADTMRLAVTTSFHNSGLSDILLPRIKSDLDLDVQLLVVGTGQALRLGRAGDVDAILVHSRAAEDEFVAQGYGTYRREIMYNDFVLVGPSDDPAATDDLAGITEGLTAIHTSQSLFVSRGDDSGTHRRELSYWRAAGLDPDSFAATWYRAAGAGMGAALNVASGLNAYILADRASWLKFANKGDLTITFEGDEALFNQYAYIAIDPARHAHVNHAAALRLENWLTSEPAQNLIGDYRIEGEVLFTPNAKPMDQVNES